MKQGCNGFMLTRRRLALAVRTSLPAPAVAEPKPRCPALPPTCLPPTAAPRTCMSMQALPKPAHSRPLLHPQHRRPRIFLPPRPFAPPPPTIFLPPRRPHVPSTQPLRAPHLHLQLPPVPCPRRPRGPPHRAPSTIPPPHRPLTHLPLSQLLLPRLPPPWAAPRFSR